MVWSLSSEMLAGLGSKQVWLKVLELSQFVFRKLTSLGHPPELGARVLLCGAHSFLQKPGPLPQHLQGLKPCLLLPGGHRCLTGDVGGGKG